MDPFKDGVTAEVVMRLQSALPQPDPAFGLKLDLVAQTLRTGEDFTKDRLGLSAAIDIRMVENLNANPLRSSITAAA